MCNGGVGGEYLIIGRGDVYGIMISNDSSQTPP
ncbi:hypothetical protein Ct9H90mP29_16370 [bacterium]|nr:MAG: hypothetical protein Ct9H90mP29_16370 [bacterium]